MFLPSKTSDPLNLVKSNNCVRGHLGIPRGAILLKLSQSSFPSAIVRGLSSSRTEWGTLHSCFPLSLKWLASLVAGLAYGWKVLWANETTQQHAAYRGQAIFAGFAEDLKTSHFSVLIIKNRGL